MNLMTTLSRVARIVASNPRVQRGVKNLAREGVRRWQARQAPDAVAPVSDAVGALADRDPSTPVHITYAPSNDGEPDPGEIVWARVPFEEDLTKSKDRPLLVLAIEGEGVQSVAVGLMLTSRDRGMGDHTDRYGNRWVDIGTGAWDSKRRPSEVRVNRLIQVRVSEVRREGAKLDRERFDRVAKATREEFGW